MASLQIQERFDVPAPPDLVFSWLVDPERVVVCLPGAALDGREEDGSYSGSVTVKVGAVTVAYRGTMVFEEVDETARRVRLEGTGREKTGSGSARMHMEGRVEEVEGGARVVVDAQVEIAGKIVRFGRGMIERVSREVFKEFASCLAGRVEAASASASRDDADGSPAAAEASTPPDDETRPLRALPLLLRTLWSWLKDLFSGRGRRRD